MEARAQARYVRVTPRKARRVLDLIRGLPAAQAQAVLAFAPQAASEPVGKVLASAIANAETTGGLDRAALVVSRAWADEGPTLKRFRPRAQGRAYRINKRTSHITVVIAEQQAPAATTTTARRAAAQPERNQAPQRPPRTTRRRRSSEQTATQTAPADATTADSAAPDSAAGQIDPERLPHGAPTEDAVAESAVTQADEGAQIASAPAEGEADAGAAQGDSTDGGSAQEGKPPDAGKPATTPKGRTR